MTIFNAYTDPASGDTTCLPDRFNWLAFLLPPVWALAHGLWRELLVMVIGAILLDLAAGYFDLPFLSLYGVGALYLGFEAHILHGRALLRRGWQQTAALTATDRIAAETEADRRHLGKA